MNERKLTPFLIPRRERQRNGPSGGNAGAVLDRYAAPPKAPHCSNSSKRAKVPSVLVPGRECQNKRPLSDVSGLVTAVSNLLNAGTPPAV
jgi:hypothetical protein